MQIERSWIEDMPIFSQFSSGGYTRGKGFAGGGRAPAAAAGLYTFVNATFTPGGQTGRSGPSLSQVRNGLTGIDVNTWKNNTSFVNSNNGIITWTVPTTGSYTFELGGARGANAPGRSNTGGYGARFTTNSVSLTEGQSIRIQIGQTGTTVGTNDGAGGGGGTSVYNSSTGTLIAVSGGGGGAGSSQNGRNAQNQTSGGGGLHGDPGAVISNGGSGGNGGNQNVTSGAAGTCAYSGAGWSGNGPGTSQCGRSGGSAAQSLSGSAVGGQGENGIGVGGFGGGGGGANNNGYGGGAGGYSGGGAGGFPGGGGGGFGGSFSNHGINSFTTNSNTPGFVTITLQ